MNRKFSLITPLGLALALFATSPAARAQTNTAFDLDATHIERTPRIDFDPASPTGGWPAAGQDVQWVAHIRNWGSQDVPSAHYRFTFDGQTVAEGDITDWKAGTEATVAWPWKWETARHTLTFQVDPDGAIAGELFRQNNTRTIATDAVTVGVWVEDGLAGYFHDNQRIYNDGANSFEDYIQRQIDLWNKINRDAVYATAPGGIVDSIRLDEVIHVANGALPLFGTSYPTNWPDRRDKTIDLMWGFPWNNGNDVGTGRFYNPVPHSPFHYEWGLIHELNHARYLIDSYGFDVHSVAVQDLVLPDNSKMLGSPAMPYPGGDVVRYDKYTGMMDSTHYYSEYEAYAWNRIAGRRARQGNYNAPGDIGSYLNSDLPQRNHFRFVDQDFNPLANATIEVHQARGNPGEWYGKMYVQAPDLTYTTDGDGSVLMGRNPFSSGGYIYHTYGTANSVMLLVIRTAEGVVRTAFVEASDFNLEYWRGHTDDASYEVQVNTAPANTTLGTVAPGPRARLSGRVLDDGGLPVAGAYVGVHPDGDAHALTNGAGEYVLSVPAGQPITVAAHRLTSMTTVSPLSNRVTLTPAPGAHILPDMVLRAAVPNAIPANAAVLAAPGSSNIGLVTDPNYKAYRITDRTVGNAWKTTQVPAGFITRDNPLMLTVDLPTAPLMNELVIVWTTAYARGYRAEISEDGVTYTTIHATDRGTGGYVMRSGTTEVRRVDVIPFPAAAVKKIRVSITNQSPQVGYTGINEIQAAYIAPSVTMDDARAALEIAAGLRSATPDDISRLNTAETAAGTVDLLDAAHLLRTAMGL